MDFDNSLINTLHLEGGYTVDKTNGQPTNRGIRQDIYNSFAKQNNLPKKDVRELTLNEVKYFYKKEFWDRNKLDRIPDENLKSSIFDFAANAGSDKAVRSLQKLVGAKQDGKLGKETLGKLGKYLEKNDSDTANHMYLNERAAHYTDLYNSNPVKYGSVIQGWYNRISNLKDIYGLNKIADPQAQARALSGQE